MSDSVQSLQVDANNKFSPISLDKVIKQTIGGKPFTVLLNNTGLGIKQDADCVYINIEDRKAQALFYVKNMFNGKITVLLFKYLEILFFNYDYSSKYPMLYDLGKALETDEKVKEEYKNVCDFVAVAEDNPAALQAIGLIQLLGWTLKKCQQEDARVRIFIEEPETNFHPQQERAIMTVIYGIRKEYGFTD